MAKWIVFSARDWGLDIDTFNDEAEARQFIEDDDRKQYLVGPMPDDVPVEAHT